MARKAGRLRRAIHRHMLKFDERICRRLAFPPTYQLPDNEAGRKLAELLRRCASSNIILHYDNGLRVPPSIFYSAWAPMLLSSRPQQRRMVTTPYFFGSRAEILVSEKMVTGPWGPLAERSA